MSTLHVLGNPHSIEHYIEFEHEAEILHHPSVEALLSSSNPGAGDKCLVDANAGSDISHTLSSIAGLQPSLPTLVIGDRLPADAVRSLSRIEAWDTLPATASPDDVQFSLETLGAFVEPPAEAPPQNTSECFAFVSTVGGAGATLLAVEAAFQLRQSKSPPSVALVDLNFVDGMVSTYLNCEPGLNRANLSKDPSAIDPVFLKSLVTPHPYGIDVVAAPCWTSVTQMPSREYVLCLLDIICEQYDVVILDLPRWPSDWSRDVMSGCDAIVLVSELTVPALKTSRRWMEHVATDPKTENVKLWPILNRQKASVFGTGVSHEQANAALNKSVFGQVRSDWSSALAALNLGQAVGDTKPNSVISKDMSEIIHRLRAETQSMRVASYREAA